MGESGLFKFLAAAMDRESIRAFLHGKTAGVDWAILVYSYLLCAPGAAAALVDHGEQQHKASRRGGTAL